MRRRDEVVTDSDLRSEKEADDAPPPARARLPGFLNEDDVGLGDAIARVTRTFGVAPCDRCKRRAAALNQWLVFRGRAR